MLGFRDSEKVVGINNELFPLVIMDTVGQFNVLWILIDGESSCDILYPSLFEEMDMNRASLIPYKDCIYKHSMKLPPIHGIT